MSKTDTIFNIISGGIAFAIVALLIMIIGFDVYFIAQGIVAIFDANVLAFWINGSMVSILSTILIFIIYIGDGLGE